MADTFTIYLVLLHHTAILPGARPSSTRTEEHNPLQVPSHDITESIQASAWKVNSRKFAFLKFSEVVKILIQFTSNSHLHPLHSTQQPTK